MRCELLAHSTGAPSLQPQRSNASDAGDGKSEGAILPMDTMLMLSCFVASAGKSGAKKATPMPHVVPVPQQPAVSSNVRRSEH